MLKLTGRANGLTAIVPIAHIALIDSDVIGALVWIAGKEGHLPVKETVEEIMAMEPMVYFMHPPMIVPSGQLYGGGSP